jgi:hypothetical protein
MAPTILAQIAPRVAASAYVAGPMEPWSNIQGFLGGLEPTVTGKNCCGLVDQDWVGPNQIDAFHQPGDLAFGMPPRVVRERL